MELFSFCDANTPLLLSASDSGLFLHPVRNERFGHPFLLCSGYKNGFSGCIYNDSLYYVYINKENSLLLRRLHESTLLFRSDSTDAVTYRAPQLVPLGNTLLLFYFEEEHGSYRLKLRVPLSGSEPALPEAFQTAFPKLPTLSLQTTDRYLYLFLTAGKTTVSYRYSLADSFEALCPESELLSGLRLPWECEKKQLEQGLMQAIHLSEQQQNLLTEKEQKMQLAEAKLLELSSEAERANTLLSKTSYTLQSTEAQLAECEQKRFKTAQELEQTSLLLERAKTQYNELMQVAEQYRQEALKWYGKFTDRH
ncbi:MAG: hypothetical protein IJ427_07860 [Lachnospiraceae bacterium]|nr:hypothetical protein [Lachnospiraceae bacterium]